MGRKDGKRHSSKPSSQSTKSKEKTPKGSENDEPTSQASTSKSTTFNEETRSEKTEEVSERPASQVPRSGSRPLSSRSIEEKEHQIERLINSLRQQKGNEGKSEYIERVINSISDLLRMEESLESEGGPKVKSKTNEEEKNKQAEAEPEKDDQEQICAFCKAASTTRCTGCHLVFYCDRECQKKDWKMHKDVCRPYTITKKKETGRILIASRDLKAEDLILHEAPLVLGPRPGSGPVCLTCFKRITTDYRCSRCTLNLCSEQCEKGEQHSTFECQVARNAEIKLQINHEVPDRLYDAVTALRCLIAKRKEPQRWETTMERFDMEFLKLVGSSESNGEQLAVLKHRLKIHSHPDLTSVSDSEIQEVLGLLQIHNTPTKLPYGEVQGLFPVASLMSHSCIPNTKIVWDNESKKVKITAAEAISRGTPITTIYTDILWGTRARRDHLQQTRMISCTCARCKDPTELGTYFSSLVCRRCSKKSSVLPLDPLNNNAFWACGKCDHQVNSGEVLQQTLALGAAVSEALHAPSVESLEALQKEWSAMFHSNHYHLHAIKHSLLQLYGRAQEKADNKDDNHWEEIAKKEKACKEFLRVCSLLDPSLANTIPYVGLTFFEYHKTILQNAKRNFSLAKINTLQLKKRMLLSKELLKKAMEIFKGEAVDTPEGQLFLTCQEEFIAIGKWMLAVGLV